MHAYANVVAECAHSTLTTLEPVRGRDGLWGAAIVTDNKYFFVPRRDDWAEFQADLLKQAPEVAVWDVRRILDWPLSEERIVWDVKSIYGGEAQLPHLAREMEQGFGEHTSIFRRYLDLDQKMIAHARALKTARIEMSAPMAVPPDLIRDWVKARTVVVNDLHRRAQTSSGPPGAMAADYESRWPFILALRRIEFNGIHIDVPYAEAAVQETSEPAHRRALRSMLDLSRDGLVIALYNPMGGKTGRVNHEGGFNALAIPHGPPREAIVSRFDGGLIYSLDFNAIDYRCIVNSVGGEVKRLYEGAEDFHERTASFIFNTITPKKRDAIKFLSYIYIYGGSEETLAAKTGWTLEQVRLVLDLLDEKIAPIKEFRQSLHMQAQRDRYVDVPGGRRLYCGADESPGAVIGKYAQTYSSWVFEQAVVRAQRALEGSRSKVIFVVHDELVIDAHPDELELIERVRSEMQQDGHRVKSKSGRTYGSLE